MVNGKIISYFKAWSYSMAVFQMNDAAKAPYVKKAEADKARYAKEMAK